MPNLPPKLPTKLIPRGDFNPDEFRTLFAQRGKQVLWEMAALCPCSTPVSKFEAGFGFTTPTNSNAKTGEARPDCPVCAGKGWYAHSSQTITVLLHAMSLRPARFGVSGDYARGRASVSVLPENKLALGDRLTVLHSVQRVMEYVPRKAGATQALRFPIAAETLNLATGATPTRVLQAMRALTAGTVANAQAMVEGVDFSVDGTGKILWNPLSANIPAVGDLFTITYYAHPRYVIEEMPAVTRDDQVHYKTLTPQDVQLPQAYRAIQEYRGDGVNPETGGT